MFNVLRYIYRENSGIRIIKYLFLGVFWQLFKRFTRSLFSKKLFNGKNILLYPDSNVSSYFFYTRIPDKAEIDTLRRLARSHSKSIFLDIGANIGSYSLMLCDLCAQVLAFEPHPYTFWRCKMNFLFNHLDERDIHRMALSNVDGELFFSNHGGSSSINHIVQTHGIDPQKSKNMSGGGGRGIYNSSIHDA
ncbi:MAG: FkbM family methyltransferase [Wolinella sp.]